MSNAHLDSIKASYYQGHREGQRIGQQQIIDAAMIHMARTGGTKEQAQEFFDEINKVMDEYAAAFKYGPEMEIPQSLMDEELKFILGDDCLTFEQRYPEIRQMGYDKPVHEERHPAAKKRGRKKH